MKVLFSLIASSFLSLACTDDVTATRILRQDGYDQIETTGYRFFGCGKDDLYATGFIAYKNGNRIVGVICAGIFKSSTIRID